jgi:hypothetical protein
VNPVSRLGWTFVFELACTLNSFIILNVIHQYVVSQLPNTFFTIANQPTVVRLDLGSQPVM